ncbi:MAG: hypothetical protein V8S31_09290 [Lachnospiraceae bacterium]
MHRARSRILRSYSELPDVAAVECIPAYDFAQLKREYRGTLLNGIFLR